MIWMVVVLFCAYLLLLFLARKEKPASVPSDVLLPFYKMGLYVYKRICAIGIPVAGRKQVVRDLERLHPGENREILCTDYYVGKLALGFVICLVGALLGVFADIRAKAESPFREGGAITRGDYEESGKELKLTAVLEDGQEYSFSLWMEPVELYGQGLQDLLTEFEEVLPSLILRENPSLQRISCDLILQEAYEGYPFYVEWNSSDPDIVSADGKLWNIVRSAEELCLTAEIYYGEAEEPLRELTIPLQVMPVLQTVEEELQQGLEALLTEREKNSRHERNWMLPENYQGKEVRWKRQNNEYGWLLWLGAIMVSVLVFFFADKDVHANLTVRKALMKRAYADVVQRVVLYMGAGLPVRSAFLKIGSIYEEEKRQGRAESPIYEEVLYACRELQSGVSEGAVYEHFGKRTGLQEYVRLSTLLMQNLKKGNSTLLQRLREEVEKACMEQLQNSRKLGEEASVKLLLPMVMMLAVVMLLIMIPAFSSVGV